MNCPEVQKQMIPEHQLLPHRLGGTCYSGQLHAPCPVAGARAQSSAPNHTSHTHRYLVGHIVHLAVAQPEYLNWQRAVEVVAQHTQQHNGLREVVLAACCNHNASLIGGLRVAGVKNTGFRDTSQVGG